MSHPTLGSESARYAIYITPAGGSPLARFGARWFAAHRPPAVPGMARERVDALLAPARAYGFHATLKAPFTLAAGVAAGELLGALDRFAKARAPVIVPPLILATLGPYVALRPRRACPALDTLAADCVRQFDGFRAASSRSDLARRRAAGLTARQEALLKTWGYPYVMEEFRCHMTLAGPATADEITLISAVAARRSAGPCEEPLTIDALSLVVQPRRDAPFRLLRRIPLAGAA